MTIQRNDLVASGMEAGMKQDNAVELPFPVVYFWAINGASAYKAQGGAPYFGGFACKSEQLDEVMGKTDRDIPAYVQLCAMSTRDGKEYEAYTSRFLTLIPIASRERWMIKEERGGGYKLHFDKAAGATTQHIQVLCFLASTVDKHFIPWGPVVVSAKGYQSKFLADSFKQWNESTLKLRSEVAPGWPANSFWQTIGNFGDKPNVMMVGQTGSQSPVTPISLYLHPNMDGPMLEKLWVGLETAQECNALRESASEWLNAWKAGLEQSVQGNMVTSGDESDGNGPNPFPF